MLVPIDQLNFILSSLAQSTYLQQARLLSPDDHQFLKKRNVIAAIAGAIIITGKTVQLCVGVRETFPRSLPVIFLSPPDAFGMIPHLDGDGYVCYAQTEGLLLNAADPVGILYDSTERAISVIQAGATGENRLDFMDELPLYWERVSTKTLPGFWSVDNVLREVFVYSSNSSYKFIADSIETVEAYFNGSIRGLNALTRRAALYIPLKEGAFAIPPNPEMWTAAMIQQLVEKNLSWENQKRFAKLRKKWKSKKLVILGLPRPKGGMALAGLDFANVHQGNPVAYGGEQTSPTPIAIHRYDSDYLLPRGGGRQSLHNVRAVVIGCGSVGGYVVFGLVQAGIRNLALVDPDSLQRENTYRHVLGMSAENQPKVAALQDELERKYPYLSITAHQLSIEEALRGKLVKLCEFDLIVVAVGDPTLELYLNQVLHKECQRPTTVFAWVEPYGIGGHALLTRSGQPGCIHCLFTDAFDPDTPLYNRSAFAAFGQSFGKDDLGCDTLYTPFGGLDAQKTAEQAVRLAIDGVLLREQRSSLLSWKGYSEDFMAAGFQLSSRYTQTAHQLYENRYAYINAECPVCGTEGQ
jgi:hypothetical protein